ncbi:ArsR/SmtB family transcription factor [Sodalis ligni]|uniref:DNA-binding transcriptional ArsR family regulator n=1 Tax=Sodalis ligni TaxID=2697027 RepID=A0A4R1NFE0_9GAMM|nr:winged helix-turn-helix domain-containing protein [Sodalis ligni]TCL06183.1 DNA-binding transcriptional ArsR family regulator [Sodalis ligni]
MLKKSGIIEDTDSLEPAMAAVAAAMADTSRIKMLSALMDGRAWTATELSVVADVASSTASAHLTRLVNEKLINCLAQGRHRYYRLAGRDIAELIETMMGVSWKKKSLPETRAPLKMHYARTCYDHLAGEIAVKIYDSILAAGWIEPDGASMTSAGRAQFQKAGILLDPKTRRKTCCACLDWSERRFHLGGHAGAAFFTHCEQKGWLTRTPGFREVTLTHSGSLAFRRLFNV